MFRIVRIVQIIKLDQLTMFPGRMAKNRYIRESQRDKVAYRDARPQLTIVMPKLFRFIRTSNYFFSDSPIS